MSIVKRWSLKEGDKLDWSWEARNSEQHGSKESESQEMMMIAAASS
jgi:hypothetical protein